MAFDFGHDFNNDFNEDFSLGLQFDAHDGSSGVWDVGKYLGTVPERVETRQRKEVVARPAIPEAAIDLPNHEAVLRALELAAQRNASDEDDIEILLLMT
jgi:hypothetical protein